jgi:prophage DNA circulation protein
MSWRDRLLPASFRGAPFFLDSSNAKPGRRTQIHEFLAREDVIADDLGRAPDRLSIKAFVIGPDYDQALAALEDALLQPGPGTLVHPTRGRMSVIIEGELDIMESPRERGGMATVAFNVVKAVPGTLAATPSTGAQLTNAANAVSTATGANFIAAFDATGMSSGFIESAISRVQDGAAALDRARAGISGALNLADTISRDLENFAADAEALVADPSKLLGNFQFLAEDILRAGVRATEATTSAVRATSDASRIITNRRTTRQTLAASALMKGIGESDAPISDATELSAREKANRDALEDISETADDATYVSLRNMGVALSAHLERVASQLPEIRVYVPQADTSSVMIAHWLYGDVRRADEIVARNKIKNPGLIAAGTRLEVTVT